MIEHLLYEHLRMYKGRRYTLNTIQNLRMLYYILAQDHCPSNHKKYAAIRLLKEPRTSHETVNDLSRI